MNTPQLPENVHDLAWWLCTHLNGVRQTPKGDLWEGELPREYDFDKTVRHIDQVDATSRLAGISTPASRTIEFHPTAVGVYRDVDDLLKVAANRKTPPARFTIMEPHFTYSESKGGVDEKPDLIDNYFNAVGLWGALSMLADVPNGTELIFVESNESRLTIVCSYDAAGLLRMPSFPKFSADFCNTSMHADQKRSIIRTALIEQFKPNAKVTLAEVMQDFEQISEEVRRSYTMYVNEFSYKKTRDEIDRQNLDDTLRLNKTLSDIQNQLLALPAAILLAGATVRIGEALRNSAVLVGVWVFCIFMVLLVLNQRSSLRAIADEIRLRREALEKLPNESKRDLASLFVKLQDRVRRQSVTLWLVTLVIGLVAVVSTAAVALINSRTSLSDAITTASETIISVFHWLSQIVG